MRKEYYFENKETLIEHLLAIYPDKEELSEVRINKILYFLYSYYAGFFNEKGHEYRFAYAPRFIVPLQFYAGRYGPLVGGLSDKKYTPREYQFGTDSQSRTVKSFIDGIIELCQSKKTHELVERTKQDSSWINARKNEPTYIYSPEDIIFDYSTKKLESQGENIKKLFETWICKETLDDNARRENHPTVRVLKPNGEDVTELFVFEKGIIRLKTEEDKSIKILCDVEKFISFMEENNQTLPKEFRMSSEEGYYDIIRISPIYNALQTKEDFEAYLICDGEEHSFTQILLDGEIHYKLETDPYFILTGEQFKALKV